MTIKISNKDVLIDSGYFDFLNRFNWFVDTDGYAKTTMFFSKWHNIPMHRLIMGMRNEIVDHIDCNPLNNQNSNLRFVANHQNLANSKKRKKPKSGFRGVYRASTPNERWEAYIYGKGKHKGRISIGCYDTARAAALAYNEKAKELFGTTAVLNIL